ncbi:hypothetical protein CCP3SC5AM1_1390006 [Gammaproteobacteria bacterium]
MILDFDLQVGPARLNDQVVGVVNVAIERDRESFDQYGAYVYGCHNYMTIKLYLPHDTKFYIDNKLPAQEAEQTRRIDMQL